MSLNFTVIDFETANPSRASVCQLGAVNVIDGRVRDSKKWMIYPPTGLVFTNTWVHGIEPEDVVDAPHYEEVIPEFGDFASSNVLVGYSSFDASAMRQSRRFLGLPEPHFEFRDALILTRHTLKLDGYRLPFVAEHLGVNKFNHHDALADSQACALIVLRLAELLAAEDMSSLWRICKTTRSHVPRSRGPLPNTNQNADPDNPLFGECICFSGALDHYTRKQAQELAASMGATVTSSPTKKTTILVEGKFDPASLKPGATVSSKVQKAMDLAQKGQMLEIIDEETFLEIVHYAG